MRLKKLVIKNFRSYYGENEFDFNDGLTLIIGDNGDGKTTFFEALEWLFNLSTDSVSSSKISEMKKSELAIGNSDKVSITLYFEHDGDKIINKEFTFNKLENGLIQTSDYKFEGWVVIGSEREITDGKMLLKRCFDTYIQRYSLFKGEDNLNVFNDETALKTLVEQFSDIKQFNKYVEVTTDIGEKAEKLYEKDQRNDKKISQQAKSLRLQLEKVEIEIGELKSDLINQQDTLNTFAMRIGDLEKYQEQSSRFHEITERLEALETKKLKIRALISRNLNLSLLDEKWILCLFSDILTEFRQKIASVSKEKRKLETDYIAEESRKEGVKQMAENLHRLELPNGAAPLDWFVPNLETMQEMLDEEVCKVCGRFMPKGSEPYNFMQQRIEEAKKRTDKENPSKQEIKPLFTNFYIEKLHNLSISLSGDKAQEVAQLTTEIKDWLDLVSLRKQELQKIDNQISDAEDERNRLLIISGKSAGFFDKNFADVKGMFEQKQRAGEKVVQYTERLKQKEEQRKLIKAEIDKLNPSNSTGTLHKRISIILDKINQGFVNARRINMVNFLNQLQENTNFYMRKLNGSDFHGVVKISRKPNDSARIDLYSSNDSHVENPSGSQNTTMYMSVLFAISDLTSLKRENNYPLIFDAPTSSFGSEKEELFYNTIDGLENKQCIIVTKDLLVRDSISGSLKIDENKLNMLSCGVYRIKKQRDGFDQDNIATVRTSVEKIK